MSLLDTESDALLEEVVRRCDLPSHDMDHIQADELSDRLWKYLDRGDPNLVTAIADNNGLLSPDDPRIVDVCQILAQAFDILQRLTRPVRTDEAMLALIDADRFLSEHGLFHRLSRGTDYVRTLELG